MKILTRLDSEWHDRTIELCNSTSVGRFVVWGGQCYERTDFGTPKLIRTKIRRQ